MLSLRSLPICVAGAHLSFVFIHRLLLNHHHRLLLPQTRTTKSLFAGHPFLWAQPLKRPWPPSIHRRMQTVYFPQWSVVAGKIFKVKELVEAENVSAHMVRTRGENVDRHGYRMTGSKMLDYVCKRCSVVTLLSLKLIERGFIRNAYLNMSVVILHSSHYFILQVFAVLKAFLTRS